MSQPTAGRLLRWCALVMASALVAGCGASTSAGGSGRPPGGRPTSGQTPGGTARPAATGMPGAQRLTGSQVTVVGDVSTARLRSTLRDAEKAAQWVTRTWGSVWSGRSPVTIEVPDTLSQFHDLGGGSGDQVSATTTPAGVVVLAPGASTKVTAEGLVVILAHELTHVALGQARLTGVPRWVIEGSAELTAYRPTGLPLARVAPALAADVRAGRVPQGPPGDGLFSPEAPRLQEAYQQAYAWCLFLTERTGLRAFTGFVRRTDRSPSEAQTAFRAAFGSSPALLGDTYSAWLRTQL